MVTRLSAWLVFIALAGAPALGQYTVFVTPDTATDDPGASGTIFSPWDVVAYHNPDYEPQPVVSFPENTILDALHKLDAPDCWLASVDVAHLASNARQRRMRLPVSGSDSSSPS